MVQSTIDYPKRVAVDLPEKTLIQVLHVDDEASFLKIAKPCLEMQGAFQVDTALSVEEAMEKLKKKTFDVIVSDYVMPRKDGLEFLKELRDSGNNIPFIIFTGKGREEVAIKAFNLDADQYLNKTGYPETVYGELAHSIRKAVKAKQAEEALKESEEKYRNLFENARNATVTFDLKGRITSINKAAVEYGFKKDETLGKSMLRFVSKKYWPRLLKELAQIARGKTIEGKIDITTSKGKRTAEYRSNPIIVDNRIVGVQTILKDITEHKKAKEALRESRRHFQKLFNAMVDPVVIVDGKGKILEISDRLVKIGGFKREELIGKNFLTVKGVTAKSKAVLIKNLTKRMMGMEITPYEVEMLTKDGRKIPAEVNATKIEYMGKPAIMAVFRGITERKKAEEELKVTLEKLKVLNEKLCVVGGLTRHDVRNKLSVVTNNVYLIKQRLAGNYELLGYLSEIESTIRQVERIFDFTGIYERLGIEELAYMNLEKCLEEAVTLFSNLQGVKVVNDCRGLTVLADSLLRQLFYNLIDNSLKHGEKVSQIRVNYEEMGKDELKLVYEDDGVGISKAEKEKIFKKGYGKDTGYGLYLIKKMCEVYGWTIRETGKQGKGAQFIITIPKVGGSGKINYRFR